MSGFVPSGAPVLHADLNHDDAIHRLGDALRSWEPSLEFDLRRGEARPYDADATGYHFALTPANLLVNRRTIPVAPGDLFVLPASFAIDADPPLDVLILKHLGSPPRHHRERFLQVQGIDHIPLSNILDGDRSAVSPETSAHPYHRVDFADALRLEPEGPAIRRAVGFVLELFLLTSGAARIDAGTGPKSLTAPGLCLIGPGTTYELTGQGVATIWRVPTEPEYEAKRWS